MGGRRRRGARRRPDRLRVPGADLDALGDGGRQCAPAAENRAARGRGAAARGGRARACWARGLRRRLSARAVRRHEDARLDRARARHRAEAPVDGRAVCSARRDHPLQAQRRSTVALAGARQDRGVRHPFSVRVGLSLAAHRGDDAAAGARVHRAPDRRALSPRRALSHLGRLRRLLPASVGGAVAGHGGGMSTDKSEARPQRERALRLVLPVVVLALGVALWEAVVRHYAIAPYVLPSPHVVFRTLVADWPVLSRSLVVTLTTTLQGSALAAIGGVGLAVLFNQSRLIEYSLYPYAVILQVTPIVAVAPLLLIY